MNKENHEAYEFIYKNITETIAKNICYLRNLLIKIYELQLDDWDQTV